MIYKFTVTVSGDELNTITLRKDISSQFLVVSSNEVQDKILESEKEVYGFGSISFWHPKKFCFDDYLLMYENDIQNFLENHIEVFQKNNVQEICVYMEVYYEGSQCNFEVIYFNKNMPFDVKIPISVYKLNKKEYKNWIKEIDKYWNTNSD